MKAANDNGKSKKKTVKEYVDEQLQILRKHRALVQLSPKQYKSLVQKVSRAIAR